jgi:hypothetical protein
MTDPRAEVEALDVLEAATGIPTPRVQCRCGTRVLPENWANHLERVSNEPHYEMTQDAYLRERAAKALDKALVGYVLPLGIEVARDIIQDVLDAMPIAVFPLPAEGTEK